MYTYDFPFSPKARTYLKFEGIFKRVEACQCLNSNAETLSLLRGVVDYMDLVDGAGGFKLELLKDLDKLDQRLKVWQQDPEADQAFVSELRDSIAASHKSLEKFTRQRTVLQQDPIIACIKPRFLTPCGVNCFDTPLFAYWNSLPREEKRQSVSKWLHELDALRTPVATILYLWRLCADFKPRLARRGFMQETAENCDLIEIAYPESVRGYPVVSGFQSSLNVRFMAYEKGAVIGDIEFELAYLGTAVL